jgi:hypothetical protein
MGGLVVGPHEHEHRERHRPGGRQRERVGNLGTRGLRPSHTSRTSNECSFGNKSDQQAGTHSSLRHGVYITLQPLLSGRSGVGEQRRLGGRHAGARASRERSSGSTAEGFETMSPLPQYGYTNTFAEVPEVCVANAAKRRLERGRNACTRAPTSYRMSHVPLAKTASNTAQRAWLPRVDVNRPCAAWLGPAREARCAVGRHRAFALVRSVWF